MEEKAEMGILERLVLRDALREALALLTPEELLMAQGRASGMSDQEVADALGIESAMVSYCMGQARERIAGEIPELRVFLDGRRKSRADRGKRGRRRARVAGVQSGLGGPGGGVELGLGDRPRGTGLGGSDERTTCRKERGHDDHFAER